MQVFVPIDALKEVGEEILDAVDVQVWVIFAGYDQEVLGQGAWSKAQEGVGDGEKFLGFSFLVGGVAFGADCQEQGVDAGGIDGVNGFDAGDFGRDDGSGDFLDQGAKGGVFLWGSSDDGEGPNGVFAMIDMMDLEEGEIVFEAIVAKMIAERPFGFCLIGIDGSGDAEVGIGGDEKAITDGITKPSVGQCPGEGDFG